MAKEKASSKTASPPKPEPVAPPPAYTVVARRYRPQQFSDLIGQEHVAQAMVNAIKSGRIAHAFLFTGARGVGKTSSARILAKALNCTTGPTATPCDQCDSCLGIISGDDVDVSEIDGASNNKVEEIRDLKSNINFRPQHSRFKIYIIDEVHMLTNSAFNALLKTLEEPPEHVKFIFATTEVQKIPITILSRCQRFDFSAIGPAKVFETLKHIVKKEGLEAEEDALHTVARRAAGSMRDAQTLLDQLLSFTEGKLTAKKLHELLGTAGDERIVELAAAIIGKDAATGLSLVSQAAEMGLQLGEMLDQIIDYWRGLMLVHIAGPNARDLPGTPSLHPKLREQALAIPLDTVLAGLDILTTTKSRARMTAHVQVLVEMAIVRLCRLEDLLSVSSLVQIAQSGGTISRPSNSRAETAETVKKNGPVNENIAVSHSSEGDSSDLTPQNLPRLWPRILSELGMISAKHLESAGLPAILGPNSLVIRFPKDYSHAYDAFRSEATQENLRRTISRIAQTEVSVRFELSQTEAPAPTKSAVNTGAPAPMERSKDLLQLPIFQKAIQVLNAQFLRVDEGFNPFGTGVAAATTPDTETDDDIPVTLDSDED
ncbi:MAG: DNA polymerase III subunit gamma/tau [Fimbriiglobus sp.]